MADPQAGKIGSALLLAERLESACCIDGKPIGRHMIEAQRTIGKVFCQSDDEAARNVGEVADVMASCIESEMRLFEELKVVALDAAAMCRAVQRTIDTVSEVGDLPRVIRQAIASFAANCTEEEYQLPAIQFISNRCALMADAVCIAISAAAAASPQALDAAEASEIFLCHDCHRIVSTRIAQTPIGGIRQPALHTDAEGKKCAGVRGEVITGWRRV